MQLRRINVVALFSSNGIMSIVNVAPLATLYQDLEREKSIFSRVLFLSHILKLLFILLHSGPQGRILRQTRHTYNTPIPNMEITATAATLRV